MRILRVKFISLFPSKCLRVSRFSRRVLRSLIVSRSRISYPLRIYCSSLQLTKSRCIRCSMCKRSEETVDLLHCEVAYALWSAFFGRFGLSWVMPRRVFDLLACWWSTGRRGSAAVWKMVPICFFFWCLWRERNNRSFEDLEGSLEDLLSSCFHTLYLWTVAHVFPASISYNDFLVRFSLSS
jgi:hypothetical protein